jgi:cell division protein FtsL
LRGKGGKRGRRDNGVSPFPPRAARRPLKPAALEWRDARLPIVGQLSARLWLPTILVAALLVSLMYLVQTSGIATTGYDIQRLQAERDDWQLRNEQLQLELAKRQSLTWIESEATGRLGMVRADPTAVTYIKDGG